MKILEIPKAKEVTIEVGERCGDLEISKGMDGNVY